MIPKSWLQSTITTEEIESIRRIDFLLKRLPEGMTADSVVDKGEWWNEPRFKQDPQWLAFKEDIRPTDTIFTYKSNSRDSWTTATGTAGFALVRNNEIINIMLTDM